MLKLNNAKANKEEILVNSTITRLNVSPPYKDVRLRLLRY